jgi:hypothetical protein
MDRSESYPLTLPALALGSIAGAFVGVTSGSLTSALAVFVILTAPALVWCKSDPPVLPFIVVFQWTSVTAGYWYQQVFDSFPGIYRTGDLERTMSLALVGLLILAAGIRITSQLIGSPSNQTDPSPVSRTADRGRLIPSLFVVVILIYGLDYVYTVNARDFGTVASFVQRLVDFREVLLVTLWLEILRQKRGLPLLFISFLWAVVPRLGSYYSDFKSPVVLMLIVLGASWRPWERGSLRRTAVAGLKAAPFVAALLVLLLIWQGGLKKNTRVAYDDGILGRRTADRVSFFVENFRHDFPELLSSPEPYVEALIERVSYITFFSRVLEHVPAREPHAQGELLKMAMLNAFVPRFIVRDKPVLPSESYYTRRFTGIPVAEAGTSISIGYMAEFYADWGIAGMFASILAFGAWIGLAAGVVRRFVAVPAMRFAALTTVLLAVADFEQQFIKGFAALNLNLIVTLTLLFVLRPWLMNLVSAPSAGDGRSQKVVEVAAR